MEKETKCIITERICECFIGGTVGIIASDHVLPKCENNFDKVVVTGGALIGSFMIGRAFTKQFLKFCDSVFGTDFKDVTDEM